MISNASSSFEIILLDPENAEMTNSESPTIVALVNFHSTALCMAMTAPVNSAKLFVFAPRHPKSLVSKQPSFEKYATPKEACLKSGEALNRDAPSKKKRPPEGGGVNHGS